MKIGIVAAMRSEINYLLTHCEIVNEIKLKKNSFYQCEYGDYDLVIVASGVGKTNASVYTQMLIDYFEPTAVINIGIGGSLSEVISPLSVVLGESFSHHDVNQEQMENLFPNQSVFFADSRLVTKFSTYFLLILMKLNKGKLCQAKFLFRTQQSKKLSLKITNLYLLIWKQVVLLIVVILTTCLLFLCVAYQI
ncbi:5'-methylthioadenosine/S-adenosylhomocysteine nucleosidase [Vagococcus fluvialis]